MLEIVTYPNPILEKKSLPIKNPTALEIKQLITEMTKVMRAHDGLGLAAPQVGQNLRLFLTEVNHELLVFINPKIQKVSGDLIRLEEGCLSFPGKFLPVVRPNKVKIKFTDQVGRKQNLKAEGLLARVIQHEFDHLEGVLFTQRAESEQRQ